jgi:SOS-response transcriptional repressor LexA
MKTVKNKQVDQKTYLKNLLEQFTKLQAASKSKIEKYEDLLKREGSKRWDEKKFKKSQQRLEQARLEYEQSFEIIDQIKNQLGRL